MLLRTLLPALLALGLVVPTASAATLYPDLQTLPPRDMYFAIADTGAGPGRNVLRFTNTAWNAGEGDLHVTGDIDPNLGSAPAVQKLAHDDGTTTDVTIGSYVIHKEHQHFHYDNWGLYQLWKKADWDSWNASGRPANVTPPIVGSKTTSCILDEEFIRDIPGTPWPRKWPDGGCDPTATGKIDTGLSPGWGDTYDHYRYDQWIDLGDQKLPDGDYVLRSVADPQNKVHESPDKADPARESVAANEAWSPVKVVGGRVVDQQAPTGTITINDVRTSTTSSNVTLRVLGRDDVVQLDANGAFVDEGVVRVRVSNDGVSWKEYAYGGSGSAPQTITWDLHDPTYGGSTANGIRTVYAQFQDAVGKWSASVTDTIQYTGGTGDPGPPPGSNSLYRTAVLGDFPLSYWRLAETTGTTAYDERSTHTGTYQRSPILGSVGLLNSDTNKSARFGGGSYVDIAQTNATLFTNNFTLEAWIRPDSLPAAGQFASVLTKQDGYSIQFNGDRLEFAIVQGGAKRRLQAPTGAIVAGQTYHVMGTYNGAEQRLYVNGQQVATAAVTGAASSGAAGLHIATWDTGQEFFHGTIDEVAIYGSTLTGLQATQHYNAGVSTAVGVATPTNLTATASSTSQIDLAWTDNSDNETGFVVERSTSSSFTSPVAINRPADATTYSDTGLSPATQYFYRVKAITATDTSGWSGAANATTQTPAPTAPAAPTALAAAAVSTSQINLTWADASSNETGFVVERSTSSSFTSPVAVTLVAGATSYSATGLSASTQYFFRVKAVNGTLSSAWSTSADATTQAPAATAPAAPTTMTATATSTSQINLTWVDASTNETGFVVERSNTSAFTSSATANLPAGATTHTSSGLTAGTQYFYRVKAINGTLSSAWSNTANAITHTASQTPAYADAVAADAPVSSWRLGETSGTRATDVRGVNHGTYRNSATLGVLGLITGTDKAIHVRNTAWTEVPDNASIDFASTFTLEAWIKPDSIPATGGWASVFAKPESYALQFNGPRLEVTVIQGGARRRLLAPAGSIVAGNTYHVVGTYDGATQRLYINGTQVASRAQTGTVPNVRWALGIGSWDGLGEHFQGTIDEAAVYNKALTAARVQAHYASGTTAASAASTRRSGVRAATHMPAGPRSAIGPAQRLTVGLSGPGQAFKARVKSCDKGIDAARRMALDHAAAAHLRGAAKTRIVARSVADARKACRAARKRAG